ncbi:MAG: hypothetical protein Q4E16_00675 [Neisseria sp.]|nr:hypothetical protein [Neisseria sp.]
MNSQTLIQKLPFIGRNIAFFIAMTASLLLWRYGDVPSVPLFAAIVYAFFGALLAMAAAILALSQRLPSGVIIQSLLLMLWQIGLPLMVMNKLANI